MKNRIFVGLMITGVMMGGALAIGATNNNEPNVTAINTELDENVSRVGERNMVVGSKQNNGENQSDDNNHLQDVKGEGSSEKSIPRDRDEKEGDFQLREQRVIQENEAITIAEKAANGKVDKIKLDEEEGLLIYEIEVDSQEGEVDLEIHAVTGEIIEKVLDE